MINTNDIPYGALYTFQPAYLEYLIHDEIYHEYENEAMEAPIPNALEVLVKRLKAFIS